MNPQNIKAGDRVLLLKTDDDHIPVNVLHIGKVLATVKADTDEDSHLRLVKIVELQKID